MLCWNWRLRTYGRLKNKVKAYVLGISKICLVCVNIETKLLTSLAIELVYLHKADWQCHVSFWKKKLPEFSRLQINLLSILVTCSLLV